jgi:two-component system sensor histidine kinase/response regulator
MFNSAMSAPLKLIPVSLGVHEGMPFADRRKLILSNSLAFCMALLGGGFLIANWMLGHMTLVSLNAGMFGFGLLSLLLSAGGFYRTSYFIVTGGAGLTFYLIGLWYRNGLENYLLVNMVASVILFESASLRILLGGLNGLAFLTVKVAHMKAGGEGAGTSLDIYVINIVLFLLALCGVVEFFRILHADYLRSVELKNHSLSEANHAKEKLFSILAHDLRTPLANIRTTLELLDSGGMTQEQLREMHPDMKRELDHAYDCLENLLAWSAGQVWGMKTEIEVLSLREVSDEACRLLDSSATRKDVSIENRIPIHAKVRGDRQQLTAIFRNLMSNSIKFTPSGGWVEATAESIGREWKVTVADNGVGMESDRARELFQLGSQPNSTTPGTDREKGLGLGLQICRDFVTEQRGRIWAESSPGTGTRIQFTLPAA